MNKLDILFESLDAVKLHLCTPFPPSEEDLALALTREDFRNYHRCWALSKGYHNLWSRAAARVGLRIEWSNDELYSTPIFRRIGERA